MNESENALPINESLWEHMEHMDYRIGIPISETRSLNILEIIRDIYEVNKDNQEEAQYLLLTLAAMFMASRSGEGAVILEELAVRESMKSFDTDLKDILNEKP